MAESKRHVLARSLRAGARLVALRRVTRDDFPPVPELFAALVAIDVAIMFVFSMVAFGVRGEINVYELSRALVFVPLVLLVGMVARRLAPGDALLTLPVALAAASVVMNLVSSALYILAQLQLLPFGEVYWFVIDYVMLGWSAAIVLNAAWRLLEAPRVRRLSAGVTAFALVVLPAFFFPQGLVWAPHREDGAAHAITGFYTLAEEKAFYTQQAALDRELEAVQPQRPGVPDVYAVIAGLYAGEDVFMKEARMISSTLAQRFDAAGRTVMLVNNVKTLEAHPIATLTSLRESLRHVGQTMDADEDVLLLYVSSHGSERHELAVDFRPLRLDPITPERLKAALAESGVKWKVVVVSACYSGGFIDALKDDRTLVITAARRDRTSFGCGYGSDATYLARALFGEALAKTHSIEGAFETARAKIEQWEREKGQTPPSEPQIHVGKEIRAKLAEVERRLDEGRDLPQAVRRVR
jgi:hypothetical protein